MNDATDLLLRFERGRKELGQTLKDFLQDEKDCILTQELTLALIAVDAEHQLHHGILPRVSHYQPDFPSVCASSIEATLIETIHEFTSNTCPITELLGELPVENAGYRFEREIGRGATGVVYEATQLSLDRTVAAKVLFLGSQDGEELSLSEGSLLASIEHDCVPTIYDHEMIGNRPCLFMRMITGPSLRYFCKEHRTHLTRAVNWMIRITGGIAECHSRGILHCDLKPDNILLDDDQPVIVDFGLASVLGTSRGGLTGSVGYLAPELRLRPDQPVMTSGDLFGLGVIFYELLTGNHPYPKEDFSQPARRPSDFNPDVDAKLEAICCKAIARDPAERFPTAQAMRKDLLDWQSSHNASDETNQSNEAVIENDSNLGDTSDGNSSNGILNWITKAASFLAF